MECEQKRKLNRFVELYFQLGSVAEAEKQFRAEEKESSTLVKELRRLAHGA